MKSRLVVSFLLVAMLAVMATAQNSSDAKKPDAENKDQNKDPLFFAKAAADVAGNAQGHALKGYIAIYIDQKTWSAALNDGDLAPFVKLKEAKPGRSVTCLFSADKSNAVCVYFDGTAPFGVDAIRAGATGRIDASNIPAAYKNISSDLLKKRDDHLLFTQNDVNSDSGQKLSAFVTVGPGMN